MSKRKEEPLPWFQLCAAGATLLALATLATQGSTSEISELQAMTVNELQEQIRADVRKALEKNATAASLGEWETSGYTAHDVFENVRALRGWTELCMTLEELSGSDAALFEEEIAEATQQGKLPCGASLQRRIQEHWDTSRQAFLEERAAEQAALSAREVVEVPALRVEKRTIDSSKGETLTRGPLKAGEINLTFDDGPHPTRTLKVLEALDRAGAKANFFAVGRAATARPDLVKEAVSRGHVVGSHSHSHQNLPVLPFSRGSEEIDRGIREVGQAAGIEIPFFRFPYGARTQALTRHVSERGVSSFLWNMDTLDWKYRDAGRVYQNAIAQLNAQKGGIILFHDVQEQTTVAIRAFLEEIARRRMTVVVFEPAPKSP
jgi:peptidoglycan/xylan/chitin deacetylase (PgdA/CDA1 family)